MQLSPPIPKQSVGRTFLVAMTIIAAVALAQIGSVCWVFMARFQAAQGLAALNQREQSALSSSTETLPIDTSLPEGRFSGENVLAPTEDPETTGIPKPTPVPVRPEATLEARLAELIEQAKALRTRGDASSALTKAREALVLAPESPMVLSELATTYEKLGTVDKALEHWRKIFDQGESAGIYYQAADAKLKTGGEASPDAETMRRETEEFQPGALLGLGEITSEDQVDPTATKRFTLRVPLKARANARIDVRDVVIQVFFYDLVDNQNVVQTSATVSSRWSTLPADWSDGAPEVLEVDYLQGIPDKLDKKDLKAAENRRYFGYVVRVYYKKELQAMRAEPVKLLKQFKPPLTLQPDEVK